ncbi:N-acetyltransferase [Paenibacillus selenitireducens]|uniref:N-acetyltransferase n=1 Tax=Paenibacillus selenitireducens TaxID=1324314 RepID=A0A1T2XGL8_9BACL|nr:N-acetyltransferase [Paenibacillus selenitireducens]
MLRTYQENDLDRMVDIWLEGSLQAHDFIDKAYWESNQQEMKNVYLPMSEAYVIEEAGSIAGFVAVVDHYLAALFVDPKVQGKGYGKKLLDHVKERRDILELKVYQENEKAVRFYQAQGFTITEELVDEHTAAKEYVMTWRIMD